LLSVAAAVQARSTLLLLQMVEALEAMVFV
jgi:hypothetical protein